jgi:hypothetical protein
MSIMFGLALMIISKFRMEIHSLVIAVLKRDLIHGNMRKRNGSSWSLRKSLQMISLIGFGKLRKIHFHI